MMREDYAEFNNPRLANVYGNFNPLTDDEAFWLQQVRELGVCDIVDLGCGTGLLTCQLARLGYKVIGVDPARPMLDLAQKKEHADKVKWIHGNFQALKDRQADLVIMTSHVAQFYLEDSYWQQCLGQIYKTLNDGGYILFDSKNPLNKPWERRHKVQVQRTSEGDVSHWIGDCGVSGNKVEYDLHYLFLDDNQELISRNKLVYRTIEELSGNLEKAGFSIENIYGDWEGDPYTKASEEVIFLARKNLGRQV